jgi:hypothetical protein
MSAGELVLLAALKLWSLRPRGQLWLPNQQPGAFFAQPRILAATVGNTGAARVLPALGEDKQGHPISVSQPHSCRDLRFFACLFLLCFSFIFLRTGFPMCPSILLPQPPKGWDHRRAPLYLASPKF